MLTVARAVAAFAERMKQRAAAATPPLREIGRDD
jgi:hypothetical protein